MHTWQPITLSELQKLIRATEQKLEGNLLSFWQSIKTDPVKWQEKNYGTEGGGFWVVAIYHHQIIWYNDIEEGFNLSHFTTPGHIDEYSCNQDELLWVLRRLVTTQ